MSKKTPSFQSYKLLAWLDDEPMSGYDIKKKVTSAEQLFGSESNSQIYPILKQLEQQHWVTSDMDETSGKRARKIYSITPEGKKILATWLAEPVELTPYKDELLMKMSMGHHLSNEQRIDQLTHYKTQLENNRQIQLDKINHLKEKHQHQAKQAYLVMAHEHLIMITETKIQWCEQCLHAFLDN